MQLVEKGYIYDYFDQPYKPLDAVSSGSIGHTQWLW